MGLALFCFSVTIDAVAAHEFVIIDLVAVKVRAVDAGEFDLAADRDTTAAAHAGAVDHDGVQRDDGLDAEGLGGLGDELHHRDRADGEHGFVTVKLQQLLESGIQYDEVLAIGPIPMMKFVSKTTEPFGVKTVVSLNPIMVDGTGMCGGCRVTVGGEVKFACVDGPDFDGHKVDYDELMSRNSVYREREAEERKTHICRIQKMGEELIK